MNEHTPHRGRRVDHCTCGTWDHVHELHCGHDVDDREPAPIPPGPVAAMPYAGVPTQPSRTAPVLPGHDITYPDVITLTEWMAEAAGFEASDIAEAVRKPWKWEDELVEAREWQAEQIAKLARSAS